MNRLDQFLNVAARQMRILPAALRDDELRELRGHLEQRVEDYIGAELSDDDARLRALEGLGSPRKLGASLCDAWEGIAFSWWRLAAAIVGVTAFLGFGIAAFILATLRVTSDSEFRLLPEIAPLLCAFYMSLPLFCGLLFSHWLGRRGCLVATLYFAALALGNFTLKFPTSSSFGVPALSTSFLVVVNAAWFPYLWIVLAFISAWLEQFWRRRKRCQLATIGANITPSSRLLWVPLNFKWWRSALLLTAFIGALYLGRLWFRFHPQTPGATLENYLLMGHDLNFDVPEILELRELPPANAT